MNGSTTVNHATNEQSIGKFHVVNVDKLPTNSDETISHIVQQMPVTNDESSCASRFQMIRVDRNFARGRWKVNDYEPPENLSTSTIPPVNTMENEPIQISNTSTFSNIPAIIGGDSNATSSAALVATAASAAAAAATAFQQQQQQQYQQRLALNNTPTVIPTGNVPPPTGLLHAYPPPGALTNLATPNQSYLLQNHPQFSYYHFYPSPYSPYAASWAAALATSNPYLLPSSLAQSQTASSLQPSNLNEIVPDIHGENTVMSSTSFSNPTADHLQNAQLAAAAAMPFLYAAHHSHSPYAPQPSAAAPSSYATIPSYHPAHHPQTILPPNQPPQSLPLFQCNLNNTTDIQQSNQFSTQQAPTLTSPKHDVTKNLIQQSSLITTPKPKTTMTDLMSSTPSIINSQQALSTLISPITTTGTSLNDILTYTTSGTPLNLTQTAAATAVAAMGLLHNANNHNTEIENEIIKELTTPTKQNNTTDIDNKISAAMDLVKMHLLSAVREEVTELRQQIRTLNEKINNIEHENTFLRQHISSEIYAQYIPTLVSLSSSNDSINSTATVIPSLLSSQSLPMTSLSSLPNSLAQQPFLSTTTTTTNLQSVPSNINFPPT